MYYRFSLYTFSMASLMEVMLSGNFKEEYVYGIKDEIGQMSEVYRDLFSECSVYLENLSNTSMEKNLLSGIGTTSKALRTLISNISGIKEGPVDEFLVDQGSRMKKSAHSMETQSIKEFAEISNPKTGVFSGKSNIAVFCWHSWLLSSPENSLMEEGIHELFSVFKQTVIMAPSFGEHQ